MELEFGCTLEEMAATKQMKNIVVVGAGAIGSYYGGMLSKAGNIVTLIGREDHVSTIRKKGLLMVMHTSIILSFSFQINFLVIA